MPANLIRLNGQFNLVPDIVWCCVWLECSVTISKTTNRMKLIYLAARRRRRLTWCDDEAMILDESNKRDKVVMKVVGKSADLSLAKAIKNRMKDNK